MDEQLRQTVRERADQRCEYCCLPQDAEPFFAYHVEHIVARQHGGSDDNENLALACYHCDAHKGPNLSGLDPEAVRWSDSLIRGWTSGKSTSSATESLSSGELR
jgi:5-methylcytosine-specific restriction endonuclease McrA